MKKITVALLSLTIILACIEPAFASSPERRREIIADDFQVGGVSENKTKLILTPYERKDDVGFADISERLEDAIKEISECGNLAELAPELENIKNDLNKKLDRFKDNLLDINDFYVYDLFDAALEDGEGNFTFKDNSYAYVMWQTTLLPEDDFYVFLKNKDEQWKLVKKYELDKDGMLTVALPGLGCIMLVCYTMHDRFFYADAAPKSPRTAG